MPNLSKIIKLTQEQYDALANGETVGDYDSLDPTVIYLVEDTGQDSPKIYQVDMSDEDILPAEIKMGDIVFDTSSSLSYTVTYFDPQSSVLIITGFQDDSMHEAKQYHKTNNGTWEFFSSSSRGIVLFKHLITLKDTDNSFVYLKLINQYGSNFNSLLHLINIYEQTYYSFEIKNGNTDDKFQPVIKRDGDQICYINNSGQIAYITLNSLESQTYERLYNDYLQ